MMRADQILSVLLEVFSDLPVVEKAPLVGHLIDYPDRQGMTSQTAWIHLRDGQMIMVEIRVGLAREMEG